MASEISDLKGCWETERQEWQDKVSSVLYICGNCILYTDLIFRENVLLVNKRISYIYICIIVWI